ncbi:hypothetical protein FB451DRAFT_1282309 [Mycena latifolia]|nr:hypothetical protein FB451DRAFT_1282309 [Mycena latifolia]
MRMSEEHGVSRFLFLLSFFRLVSPACWPLPKLAFASYFLPLSLNCGCTSLVSATLLSSPNTTTCTPFHLSAPDCTILLRRSRAFPLSLSFTLAWTRTMLAYSCGSTQNTRAPIQGNPRIVEQPMSCRKNQNAVIHTYMRI